MTVAQQLPEFVEALHHAVSKLVDYGHPPSNSGEFRFPVQDIFADEDAETREFLVGLINAAFDKSGQAINVQSQVRLDNGDLVLETTNLRRFSDRLPTVKYIEQGVSARIEAAPKLPPRFR